MKEVKVPFPRLDYVAGLNHDDFYLLIKLLNGVEVSLAPEYQLEFFASPWDISFLEKSALSRIIAVKELEDGGRELVMKFTPAFYIKYEDLRKLGELTEIPQNQLFAIQYLQATYFGAPLPELAYAAVNGRFDGDQRAYTKLPKQGW